MSVAALDARVFGAQPFRPAWQRPAVVAAVVALHALAIATLPHLARQSPQPVTEVIVDIEPEAAPAEATPPAPGPPKAPEATAEPPPPPPQDIAPPPPQPPPVAEAPAELPPPAALAPPSEEPPPAAVEQPPLPPPEPPPAPVELAPPKPPPAPPKVEVRKPAERPARARAEPRRAPAEEARTAPSTRAPQSVAASAESRSAYVGEVSAAIRGRMFYPPAARARQARGVVGVAFTIGASGAVTSFAITHSSGDAELDSAARTLVRTTRFPPPPGGSAHISTNFNYVPG